MTDDISKIIYAATNQPWSRDQSVKALSGIGAITANAAHDWDEDAGENWARVLVGTTVIAFVWMKGPLVIATRNAYDFAKADPNFDAQLVLVSDMNLNVLTAERNAVERLAGRPLSENFDNIEFSAEDLVWATI